MESLSPPSKNAENPYPGPRPFSRGEATSFVGREREAVDLQDLLYAYRNVLLYAQSGAGKSSLVAAGVLSNLEQSQWILARVSGDEPSASTNPPNTFTWNVLISSNQRIDGDAPVTLAARLSREGAEPWFLIIDQFEEIFTCYPERWQELEPFFREMQELLRKDEGVRVLFVLREDFLAEVDRFGRWLPNGFEIRYRLAGLRRPEALRAIKEPAEKSGDAKRAANIATLSEALVDSLLSVPVQTRTGVKRIKGEFVEPVHLQVVCRDLWERLEAAATINEPNLADVDRVLGEYYERTQSGAADALRFTSQLLHRYAGSMAHNHGVPQRGLLGTGRSPTSEGSFGRMFRALRPAFDPNDKSLQSFFNELGAAMINDFEPPRDGADDEESGIPALYTYLGQFIDHDITFDPAGSLQKTNDPDALVDFRTPAFDLDNLYGRGPQDQPYMYRLPDSTQFQLGKQLSGGKDQNAADLPRGENGRALIGDARNDENAIVSQLQGLFQRFHNRFVLDNKNLSFVEVQQEVRFHYQFILLNDFLPRIVHSDVLNGLRTNGEFDEEKLQFYKPKNSPFIPVEFSVAAYRLGHSMIRPGYRLNDKVLLPILPIPSQGFPEGLTGFRPMNSYWGIDWGRFIDIDQRAYDGNDAVKKNRLQFAYRIDTSLVNILAALPLEVAQNSSSLAARNLVRGWRLELPSGQDVARAMKVRPLPDNDIHIGQGLASGLPKATTIAEIAGGKFRGRCPLWTYVLAEAMLNMEAVSVPIAEHKIIQTPRLGPVGGRIVAEVFLGLMFGDPHSMLSLQPDWCPRLKPDYKLRDFVNYALGN